MKIVTRFGAGAICTAILLVGQTFGQATNTTPEAQKAAAQLSQPAGPPMRAQSDTPSQQSDRTTVPGYGAGASSAADNRPVQPIYDNSAASGGMPMRGAQANSSAMVGQHDNVSINSAIGQQRGEIGVWLVENGGQGVRVARLARGGAAEQAGLKSGDIITQVNGKNVASPREASQQIRNMAVGQTASLTLTRDGNQQELQVTLATARPGQSYQVGYGGENNSGGDHSMGGERDGNGIAARTTRLEQQMESMTHELQQMREQMSSMKMSGAGSSAIGTEPTTPSLGATPTTPSATSSSATPPQSGVGSAASSLNTEPTPTPAAGSSSATTSPAGASSAGSSTPSSTGSGSSSSSDDLFGTGSSTSK